LLFPTQTLLPKPVPSLEGSISPTPVNPFSGDSAVTGRVADCVKSVAVISLRLGPSLPWLRIHKWPAPFKRISSGAAKPPPRNGEPGSGEPSFENALTLS